MEAAIGIYDTHDKAVEAVKVLRNAGFAEKELSVIGKASKTNDHVHVKTSQAIAGAEVGAGVVAGSILGVLSGIGIFAIPGLGFLYGAGALVGAFAGLDIGLLGGGLAAILTQWGMDKVRAAKYEQHLQEGKFLVLAHGKEESIKRAEKILGDHATHIELETDEISTERPQGSVFM